MSDSSETTPLAHRLAKKHFRIAGGQLCIGGVSVAQLAEQFGTPIFVYDQGVMLRRIGQLRSIMPPRFRLFYSIKANPNAAILKCALKQGCGLEVASGMTGSL